MGSYAVSFNKFPGDFNIFEIPLDSVTSYFTQRITLSDFIYRLEFKYNERAERFSMSMYDQNENALFEGAFVVLGINFVNYIDSAGFLPELAGFLQFFGDEEPTFENLGKSVKLYYGEIIEATGADDFTVVV